MSHPKTHSTAPPLSASRSKQPARGINTNVPLARPPTLEQTRSADSPTGQLPPDLGYHPPGGVLVPVNSEEGEVDFAEQPPTESSPTTFRPFFTLIEDVNSSEYHHPTVHYIFSDDDPDLVTEAALRALDIGDDPLTSARTRARQHHSDAGDGDDLGNGSRPTKEAILPPPVPGVKERYIILDVEPSDWRQPRVPRDLSSIPSDIQTIIRRSSLGSYPIQYSQHAQNRVGSVSGPSQQNLISSPSFTITAAHSLNPDWQVLSTYLSPAPSFHTFSNDNNNHTSNNRPSSASVAHTESTPTQTQQIPRDQQAQSQPQSQRIQSSYAGQNANPKNENETLLLRIEGTAGFPHVHPYRDRDRDTNATATATATTSHQTQQLPHRQTLEEMMDQFERRMEELRRVIDASGIPELPHNNNISQNNHNNNNNNDDDEPGTETGTDLGTDAMPTIIRTEPTTEGS